MIYTFWEGPMPAYIRLCMATWKLPYTLLNYDNLGQYTELDIERTKRFTLPQIADCVRVHVLRDQGGYWLDADTIMLNGKLPDTDMVGDPESRDNSIGLLHSEPHSQMFTEWAAFQDEIIRGDDTPSYWATMGNAFTDDYAKHHEEVRIHPIADYCPEVYMIRDDIPRWQKYRQFYFEERHSLADIRQTDLLMLHNSWTPEWYKNVPEGKVLDANCTMSNILREALCDTLSCAEVSIPTGIYRDR